MTLGDGYERLPNVGLDCSNSDHDGRSAGLRRHDESELANQVAPLTPQNVQAHFRCNFSYESRNRNAILSGHTPLPIPAQFRGPDMKRRIDMRYQNAALVLPL